MALRLDAEAPGFEEHFGQLLAPRGAADSRIAGAVRRIIDDVRADGDRAVRRCAAEFGDWAEDGTFELARKDWDAAADLVDSGLKAALETAAGRVRRFHEAERPADKLWRDEAGLDLGWKWTPVGRVGVYAPGGRATYPSSVLMAAVPARVAGAGEIVLCTPPATDGHVAAAVLLAARLAGVDRVYRMGGAQAVAAMAYGTETLPAVDMVVGPGNAYVAEAKRQVYGDVGIEAVAGPSEVVVLADSSAKPSHVAWDLLAQAEHDPLARSVLITDDAELADAVEGEVERALERLASSGVARESWQKQGAIVLVTSIEAALPLIDRLAPEHLQVCTRGAWKHAQAVRCAGAVFVGAETPEAVGDYIAGPSHVLPTARSARFTSGLSVMSFLRRTTLIGCEGELDGELLAAAETLARSEGLEAHARSLEARRRAT